jgi:two-component system sensor histidine kinase RegB
VATQTRLGRQNLEDKLSQVTHRRGPRAARAAVVTRDVASRSPPKAPADPREAAHSINVTWLIRLRWGALAGQIGVIAYVQWGLRIPLLLGALAAVLGAELLLNLGSLAWMRRRPEPGERAVATALAADVTCFTALLYLTGGPMNPFSFLYLVHIALAALVLRERLAWALVLLSAAGSAALFFWHVPLPGMHDHTPHGMHGGAAAMDLHLRGMWVAFAVAAGFIVYFIRRVTKALGDREVELGRAREVAARTEKIAAMATLAAGAAHEFGTPLATIAVVAKELERAARDHDVAGDARLIREQVERCREIVRLMAGGAGGAPGEATIDVAASDWVKAALDGLPGPDRVRVEWADGAETIRLRMPLRAVAQALRNVLKNGLDASGAGQEIHLRLSASPAGLRADVVDRGRGMSQEALAHAAEPFFTTKEPGQGMGLGLFLTRSVLDPLGGALELRSTPGGGTTASLTLPAATEGRMGITGAPGAASLP